MIVEAIQTVKQAEEDANRIIAKAQVSAKEIEKSAQTLAEEKVNEILSQALEEAEALKRKAREEGEELSAPIIEKGKEEANLIRKMEESRLKLAINMIIERIVN